MVQSCLNLLEDPRGVPVRRNHLCPPRPQSAALPARPPKHSTSARDPGAHCRGGRGSGPGCQDRGEVALLSPRWPQGGRKEGLRTGARPPKSQRRAGEGEGSRGEGGGVGGGDPGRRRAREPPLGKSSARDTRCQPPPHPALTPRSPGGAAPSRRCPRRARDAREPEGCDGRGAPQPPRAGGQSRQPPREGPCVPSCRSSTSALPASGVWALPSVCRYRVLEVLCA